MAAEWFTPALVVQSGVLLFGIGVSWGVNRASVNSARELAAQALAAAKDAHAKIEQQSGRNEQFALHLQDLKNKLDALPEIRRSVEAIEARFDGRVRDIAVAFKEMRSELTGGIANMRGEVMGLITEIRQDLARSGAGERRSHTT